MIRAFRGNLLLRFRFGNTPGNNTQQVQSDKLSEEFLEEYKLGLITQKENKFLISNQYLRRSLAHLES